MAFVKGGSGGRNASIVAGDSEDDAGAESVIILMKPERTRRNAKIDFLRETFLFSGLDFNSLNELAYCLT